MIEGEIGYIGTSSEVIAEKPANLALSTPEEAMRFVKETGVDVLAPAVGNMHGLLKTMVAGNVKKRLDIARIAEIKKACGIFMTFMAVRELPMMISKRLSLPAWTLCMFQANFGSRGAAAWKRALRRIRTRSRHIRSCLRRLKV